MIADSNWNVVIYLTHLNECCPSLNAVCSLESSFEFPNLIPMEQNRSIHSNRIKNLDHVFKSKFMSRYLLKLDVGLMFCSRRDIILSFCLSVCPPVSASFSCLVCLSLRTTSVCGVQGVSLTLEPTSDKLKPHSVLVSSTELTLREFKLFKIPTFLTSFARTRH